MERVIVDLCLALGVPVSFQPTDRRVPWDGSRMHTEGGRWAFDPFDLSHELAHWLCADADHRCYRGFGLGPAPDRMIEDRGFDPIDDIDGPLVSDVDEQTVLALGLLLLWAYEPIDAYWWAFAHGFDPETSVHADEDTRQLAMFRLLVESLRGDGAQRALVLLRAAGIVRFGLADAECSISLDALLERAGAIVDYAGCVAQDASVGGAL